MSEDFDGPPEQVLVVGSVTLAHMRDIARAVAGRLVQGDVVALTGDLAAGKTTFVKAAVAAMGSADAVTSPTFAIAQFYGSAAGRVLHIDAYRLDDVHEYRDLGLDEHVEECVTFVEWEDRIGGEFREPLRVHLAVDPDDAARRTVTVRGRGRRWLDIGSLRTAEGLERDVEGVRA